ncbi:MAG: precorrin-6y C5,15-methyltransferase (decarboxylating) subunit CbiE [Antricoccus sp.]
MSESNPSDIVYVVGIGADGISGLSAAVHTYLDDAEVIFGSTRQLAGLTASKMQTLVPWPSPLLPAIRGLLDEHAGARRVVLASGDPLTSGIGTTLLSLFGTDKIRILPGVSSTTLARARVGWSAESSDVITVVGRHAARVLRSVGPARRLVVLSSDESSPAQIATLLTDAGYGASTLHVLGNLGAPDESRQSATARTWATDAPTFPRLNVVCCECRPDPGTRILPTIPGLPDDAFDNDGQLTKREIRASALAHLAPIPGDLLWDVGAGAGSIAIEWMRADPRCQAVAIEQDATRATRMRANAERLGVPDLHVAIGTAPQAFAGLPSPQAIFIGGGGTEEGIIEASWSALAPGGRLVAHAVTVQTEAVLMAAFSTHGGELSRLSVERLEPIGGFDGWSPARAVVQWSAVKDG